MSLDTIFTKDTIKLNLAGTTKEAVLRELIEMAAAAHAECAPDEMLAAVNEREGKMSTGIGSGIAVPHGYCRNLNGAIGVIGVSRAGIDYDALDQKPVHVVFLLLMNEAAKEQHLRVLNSVFTLANSGACDALLAAGTVDEAYALLSPSR